MTFFGQSSNFHLYLQNTVNSHVFGVFVDNIGGNSKLAPFLKAPKNIFVGLFYSHLSSFMAEINFVWNSPSVLQLFWAGGGHVVKSSLKRATFVLICICYTCDKLKFSYNYWLLPELLIDRITKRAVTRTQELSN